MKLFFFLIAFHALALERRDIPTPLKISVIIPCHPDHFVHLAPLLATYEKQTSLPDEIVISLSECEKVPQMAQATLMAPYHSFAVKLVKSKEKQMPGKNRNCACQAATGNLIVCQDADDLPHPQRIEIIRYLSKILKSNIFSINGSVPMNHFFQSRSMG